MRPSGLATCDATLARCLVRATPIDKGRPISRRTRRRMAVAISLGGPKRWTEPPHVKKGFVYGDPLDSRSELGEDGDDIVAELLVTLEVPTYEEEIPAKLAGLPARHATADAVAPGFIRGGQHHTAPHCDGPVPQRGVQQLLDGRVEGVEVRVQDGRCPDRWKFHAAHGNRTYVRFPEPSAPQEKGAWGVRAPRRMPFSPALARDRKTMADAPARSCIDQNSGTSSRPGGAGGATGPGGRCEGQRDHGPGRMVDPHLPARALTWPDRRCVDLVASGLAMFLWSGAWPRRAVGRDDRRMPLTLEEPVRPG